MLSRRTLAVFFQSQPYNAQAILNQVANNTGYDAQGFVTGEFFAIPPISYGAQGRRQYLPRPVPCGVSIGHYLITAGTLGCLVRHTNGRDYVLSNNHVLANSNTARVGDPIYQPGPYDGGTASSRIANLSSWVTLGTSINFADAALAEPAGDTVDPSILDIGALSGIADVELEDHVRKSGRTTGLTDGTVRFLGAYVRVNYGNLGNIFFDDQVVIESQTTTVPFSSGGDSGSIIVDDGSHAVGLLFAGSPTFTLANPIRTVFQRLNLTHVIA